MTTRSGRGQFRGWASVHNITVTSRCPFDEMDGELAMSSSSWTWSYEPDGTEAEAAETFTSQSDAESWLGEAWRRLAEAGVTGVTLLHDGAKVYGPMPLSE